MPKITCDLPQCPVDASVLTTFKQLQLADVNCHQPGLIDILLGADVFGEIMLSGHLNVSRISALESIFGWVILGKTKGISQTFISNHASCNAVEFEVDKFWQLEEISDIKPYTQEETACENHFIQTFSRDSTGIFAVKFPFRKSSNELTNLIQEDLRLPNASLSMDDDTVKTLGSHASRWKTFVANRVAKIQTLSSPTQWHHVSGNENPADLATRGVSSSALLTSLWLCGPEFLYNECSFHPESSVPTLNDSVSTLNDPVPEERCCVQSTIAGNHLPNSNDLFQKYSSLSKLKRVTAYCLRFVNNCRNSKDKVTGILNTSELTNAINVLIKSVQFIVFNSEINALKRNQALSCRSKVLSLNPFLDNSGILRVGGRLRHANIAYGHKHPILLSKRHILIDIIVRHYHEILLHAGPQLVQSSIQEQYWIVQFFVPTPLIAPFESFSARVAQVGLFSGVSPNVSNQLVRAAEGPRAHSALEGLLSSVPLQMTNEIAVAEEPTDTVIDGAGVKSLARPFFFFMLVGTPPTLDWHRSGLCKVAGDFHLVRLFTGLVRTLLRPDWRRTDLCKVDDDFHQAKHIPGLAGKLLRLVCHRLPRQFSNLDGITEVLLMASI
ncbi:reverse transcriptase [Caerostris darwini]|uniref:Reverse transcriptase n=1 Tax=Caerostris darwini TaxID=1538125 RepID=A0AAV4NT72_9ARAC|nr:reverse transcriptase [Caerostris darwini]